MKLVFVFALILATPLVCKPRTKNKPNPFWEIKELDTKRKKRGKKTRGRSSRDLRTQWNLIKGSSVQEVLRLLEPEDDDVSTN